MRNVPSTADEFLVYTKNEEFSSARLSGIGIRIPEITGGNHPPGADFAPLNAEDRWDTVTDRPGAQHDFRLMKEWSFGHQAPETYDQPWGFAVHSSCWDILAGAFAPKVVNPQRLFEICLSLPMLVGPGSILDWGHEYGLLSRSWANGELIPKFSDWLQRDILTGVVPETPGYCHDPMGIPPLYSLANSCAAGDQLSSIAPARGCSSEDCFSAFPTEVLQMILNILPSRDVLNIQLASREFASFALTQGFWRSRFDPGHEFDYIFEARSRNPRSVNWRSLYFEVKGHENNPAVLNRRRIYAMADQVCDILSGECLGFGLKTYFDPYRAEDDRSWRTASRAVTPVGERFDWGCRILKSRVVNLPDKICGCSAALAKIGSKRYITGLLFHLSSGDIVSIGYINKAYSCTWTMLGDQTHPSNTITGFHVSADRSGIRAISCVNQTGQISDWIGDFAEIPKRRLVLHSGHLCSVKCDFDGFKMIALSIPGHHSDYDHKHRALVIDNSFWHPDIPSDQLIFRGPGPSSAGGRRKHYPFSGILFGGISGQYLPHLTLVVFWVERGVVPTTRERGFGISVKYNVKVDGHKVHNFGQVPGRHQAWPGGQGTKEQFKERFKKIGILIDGPGGERITQLDTQVDRATCVFRVRVHTNYGQYTQPKVRNGTEPNTLWNEIKPEAETIVGFYMPLGRYVVVTKLGIVSIQPESDEADKR